MSLSPVTDFIIKTSTNYYTPRLSEALQFVLIVLNHSKMITDENDIKTANINCKNVVYLQVTTSTLQKCVTLTEQ